MTPLFLISCDNDGQELSRWKITSCTDMIPSQADPEWRFIYKAISGERVE